MAGPFNPHEFLWSTSNDGYELTAGPAQTLNLTEVGSGDRQIYRPLDDPALYLQFTQVGTEPEAILAFANSNGFLERGQAHHRRLDDRRPHEPLQIWVRAIEELRAVVEFSQLLVRNEIKKLGSYVQVVDVDPKRPDLLGTYKYLEPPRDTVPMVTIVDPFIPDKRLYWLILKDPAEKVTLDPALHVRGFLEDIVNRRLDEGAAPQVSWDPRERRFRLGQTPTSLLGALWLQFSLALADNVRIGTCRRCGASFEVGRQSSRADRRYCSNKCRTKAYRNRKERAVELAAAGKTQEQIAEVLGVDSKVVGGWISQPQAARSEKDKTTGESK